ncbi:MAG: hypothetical protein K2K89_13735 [Ruminococcus sp.]|nr:hypothetical protein [Ruminococcus sp.]
MKMSERNEITNKDLKEMIAETALSIMTEGEDYEELVGTSVTFGYLFDIDNHGIEALFKVITDKTTAYFAVQGEKMMRLNFNEELFQSTTDVFLSLHK